MDEAKPSFSGNQCGWTGSELPEASCTGKEVCVSQIHVGSSKLGQTLSIYLFIYFQKS